jgi:single-strand DNA-binding protein
VKGQELYVEGRLETSTWDDADGKKNYKTEIVGNNFQFGQKPSGAGGGGAQAASAGSAATGAAAAQPSKDVAYPDEEIDPEDIPF